MLETIPKNEILLSSEFSKRLIELIEKAKNSIHIFMFDWRWYKDDFSCDVSLINQALVRAYRRGVEVKALLNYYELLETLAPLGIKAKKANIKKLLHAKSIVIDNEIAIIGSHNLSNQAMRENVEISAVIYDIEICTRIKNYFDQIWRS